MDVQHQRVGWIAAGARKDGAALHVDRLRSPVHLLVLIELVVGHRRGGRDRLVLSRHAARRAAAAAAAAMLRRAAVVIAHRAVQQPLLAPILLLQPCRPPRVLECALGLVPVA